MNRRLPVSLRTRDDDPVAVFMRGATVGLFVGAVIAGSTIWRNVRLRPSNAPAGAPSRPAGVAPRASRTDLPPR